MSGKHKKLAKRAVATLLLLLGLGMAFEAITHSAFYGHLEQLNMDNHQH